MGGRSKAWGKAWTRLALGAVIGAAALAAATPAAAQFGGGPCTRADLKKIADQYVAEQQVGDATGMPFGQWVRYNENMEEASMLSGMFSKPVKIDFSRSILDATSCKTFTEVVVTDPAHPYVLGTVITAGGGSIGQIDMLVTDKDDWLFNAKNTMDYSKGENWNEIPAADRDSRETIKAAADAYLDSFNDKKIVVPWATPCARLEGGLYTGKGKPGEVRPDDTCNVGVPSGVKIVNRQYIIDENLGAVAVLSSFGNNSLPDFHTFRVEKGKIRYVHTITVCKTPNCGFKLPDQLKAN